MRINRQRFYEEFRKWRGVVLPDQIKGLNFLLDCIENDPHITRLDWASYILATTMHETAFTFLPVHEYGSRNYFISRYGSQTRVGQRLGNDTPEEGALYAGRGDVQLTGEANYEKAEIALRREYPALILDFERRTGKRFDLTAGDQPNDSTDPNNAQDPQIAYAVMSYGMRTGMFTGRKLSDYFNQSGEDWINARRIINGTDKAQKIAEYGRIFYKILSHSLSNGTEAVKFSETSESNLPPADKTIDVQQESAKNPTVSDNQPSQPQIVNPEVNITDSDVKKVEATPIAVVSPATPPVEIPKETPSFQTRVSSGLAYLASIGTLAYGLIKSFFEQIEQIPTVNLVLFGVLVLGLAYIGFLIYDRSANRANKLNEKRIETASSTANYTVNLVDKK